MSSSFSARLLTWYDAHGRHDLPWQKARTPYRVWLAEVMLQQTQVATVIPYFERFIVRFADFNALARASQDEVLALWAGLGYYARGRNLHRCAQIVMNDHGGELPRDLKALQALPGIGRSTAAAILAQAHGQRLAILDGNVRRVLARHAAERESPGTPEAQKRLWTLSERLLPQRRLANYTQAVMDLGATLCTARKPRCGECPVRADCCALARGLANQLPVARPRRTRPLRRAQVLLIENRAGEILLQRRPPAGIWGGLWCPPMIDAEEGAAAHLAKLGLIAHETIALPILRHRFTHFDLDIEPLRMLAAEAYVVAETAQGRWTNMSAPLELGLPTPIRTVLRSLSTSP